MWEAIMSDSKAKICLYGATGLHIIMGVISALSKDPVNGMGFMSVVLAVLCIGAVIFTSRRSPFWGPLLAILIIYLPGAILGAMVKVVLVMGLVAIFVSPIAAFIEMMVTAFPFLFF